MMRRIGERIENDRLYRPAQTFFNGTRQNRFAIQLLGLSAREARSGKQKKHTGRDFK
jgi:hypothetical protein